MNQQVREKIALIIFVLLAFFGLAALLWYLFVGHSWNVAASHIDDSVGSMDGYTAILYDGTTPLHPMKDYVQVEEPCGVLAFQPKKMPVVASTVEDSYQNKDANTFIVDMHHPQRYRDAIIMKNHNFRLGVVSFKPSDRSVDIQEQVDYLNSYGVNAVLVITENKEQLAEVQGIDLVIDATSFKQYESDVSPAGALCMESPSVGTVGAFIVSPSNVHSYKSVDSVG